MRQFFNPNLTTWHITWGTYGTRLHGDQRPTVDRDHNQRGEAFVTFDSERRITERDRMRFPPCYLTLEQCLYAQEKIPSICQRGGWELRVCSAAPDHLHVLLDIVRSVHGEKVRRLLKRWLGQSLSERWPLPEGATWWAEEGSNRPVEDDSYLNNAYGYILGQRTK